MKNIRPVYVNGILTALFFAVLAGVSFLGSHLAQRYLAPLVVGASSAAQERGATVILRGGLDLLVFVMSAAIALITVAFAARLLMNPASCRSWMKQFIPGSSIGLDRMIRRFTFFWLTVWFRGAS